MNTKKITIKKLFCSIFAVLLFVFANICAFKISKQELNTFAGDEKSEINIDNKNFNDDKNASYPIKKPDDFVAYNNNKEASILNDKCGVIDLTHADYSTKYSNAKENRVGLDNHVLMLESGSSNINYGYRTKKSISLNSNSNYYFTVDVYTATNAEIAEIALYDENNSAVATVKDINSYSTWTTYHIFVSTDEALKVKLGMNIKGAGSVLFDNISCFEVSKNVLDSSMKTQKNNNTDFAYLNNTNEAIENYTVTENKFVFNTTTVSILNTNYNDKKNDADFTQISTELNSDGTNSTALLINNKQKTYVEYSTEDNFLNFEQNTVYKVNIKAKTEELSGKATLKLVQTNLEDGETVVNSDIIEITSNTSGTSTNNYSNYSFYVKSHPNQKSTYKFVFALGDSSNETSGKLYISSVSVNLINSDNIPSSSSTAKIIDLVGNFACSNNNLYLNNGLFNAFDIEDYTQPMPAKATGWTAITGNGQQYYGVVNTLDSSFAKLANLENINTPVNPYSNNVNENVLMMYNHENDTLSYKSSSKNLTANSYHRFDISVQTQKAPVKIALVTTNNDVEFELTSVTVDTDAQWQDVSLFIKTAYQSLDVSLKVTLTTKEGYSFAYLDNAKFDYLIAPTEEEFNLASNKVDLANLFIANNDSTFASTNLFNAEESLDAIYGIVDIENNNKLDLQVGQDNVASLKYLPSENKNVLGIRTTADTHYTVTSNLGYSLVSGNKYKITVSVFTNGLRTEVADINETNLGASIGLTGFEDSFKTINTNNTWKTYTFFIEPDSNVTTYLQFSIGNEEYKAIGCAFFGNVVFESNITENPEYSEDLESQFNSAFAGDMIKILNAVKTDEDNSKNDTTTDTEISKGMDKQTLLYLIPSIIFGIAIVVAVVGVLSRKVKWKKRGKKSKNAYDRNVTVSKQAYTRKATMIREEKVRELTKQLDELVASRSKYEEEYKHDLSKIREMKIKRANATDIAKLEKDMKKNQKISASIGVSIRKLENEIEYTKSEVYFSSLMKKLAQTGIASNSTDTEE